MYDRQQRLRAKSHQTPSWQDIADHYVSDKAGPPQSRAVVCDINKEMLKVGKQRAEKAGITTGGVSFNQTLCSIHVLGGQSNVDFTVIYLQVFHGSWEMQKSSRSMTISSTYTLLHSASETSPT